jgi:hypothetical protein
MDVLVEMVSCEGNGYSWEKKLTALLVFMESPIIPVLVGTEGGSQRSSRFIVGFAGVIIINWYF